MIQIFRICRHGKVPYRRFNSPEASAHVQVQRKYGWEPSNRVCGARGAAAHACAPGLSTGRRLMPMPARCGAAAPRAAEQRRFDGRRTRGEYCGECCWEEAVCVERTELVQLHRPPNVCMLGHARARTKTRGNPDRGMRVLLGRGVGLLLAGRERNSKKCRP